MSVKDRAKKCKPDRAGCFCFLKSRLRSSSLINSGSQPFWACGTLILKTSLAAHLNVKKETKMNENVAVFANFLRQI